MKYAPSIPALIGAWVKTERKRNALHGPDYFRSEGELRAEGERAIDAHDAEVILEYVKRSKPDPIHIDNIDGVKAGDWFRARDAATRKAVLVEVAEWLESFGHYDNIAEQVLTLPPHTPQIVPETGLGA